MPPVGRNSKVRGRIWLGIRAQPRVRDKSEVGTGGLQERAGHMQLLVPRWPQSAQVLTRASRSQGLMPFRLARLGYSQPLASWVTESHNTQEGVSFS